MVSGDPTSQSLRQCMMCTTWTSWSDECFDELVGVVEGESMLLTRGGCMLRDAVCFHLGEEGIGMEMCWCIENYEECWKVEARRTEALTTFGVGWFNCCVIECGAILTFMMQLSSFSLCARLASMTNLFCSPSV